MTAPLALIGAAALLAGLAIAGLVLATPHGPLLARMQRALDEIEYHEALAPLAELAGRLQVDLEAGP